MPRNIQQAWTGPTVFEVDPPSAVNDGTLTVGGGGTVDPGVAGEVAVYTGTSEIAGSMDLTFAGGTLAVNGTIDAAAFDIAGNSVLTLAQQGTITAYGPLTFGTGTTLDTGGTITVSATATQAVKETVFTSSGTWTKDPEAVLVQFIAIGGGGSGGGGGGATPGFGTSGGSGGAPGDIKISEIMDAASLPGTPLTVTIGATATGGTGAATTSTAGADGAIGGNASINTTPAFTAYGGGGGTGGSVASVNRGGSGPSDISAGALGGTSSTTVAGSTSYFAGAAGGSQATQQSVNSSNASGNPGGGGATNNASTQGLGGDGFYKHAGAGAGGGISTSAGGAGGRGGITHWETTSGSGGANTGGTGGDAVAALDPYTMGSAGAGGGGSNFSGKGGAGGSGAAIFGAGGGGGGSGGTGGGNGGDAGAPVFVVREFCNFTGGGGSGITSIVANGLLSGGTIVSTGTIGLAAGAGIAGTGGTIELTENVMTQTGTTYAFAASDLATMVTFSNTASIAATIAQAGTATFPAGWWADIENLGAGYLTLTPTTSTINGTTKLMLGRGGSARVVSDGTNYFAMTGGLIQSVPSSTPTTPAFVSGWPDGLTRGTSAIDIQTSRTAFTYASGSSSITFGTINTASASKGTAIGTGNSASGSSANTALGYNNQVGTVSNTDSTGIGSTNVASGSKLVALGYSNVVGGISSAGIGAENSANATSSFALGYQCFLTGDGSSAFGVRAVDRGNSGAWVWASTSLGGSSSLRGRSQEEKYIFIKSTAGSSAVRLTTDGAAASAGNIAALGTHSTQMADCWFCVTDTSTGDFASYYTAVPFCINQGTSSATTTLGTPGPSFTAGDTSSTPLVLAAGPTIAVDTLWGGYDLEYTPPVSNTNTLYAVAVIRIMNTRFN